jgi:hypothetical protein
MNRAEVAEPHHVRNAAGIATVGLVRPRGQEALRVPRLNADRPVAAFNQAAVEPFGERTCLDPDERDRGTPTGNRLDD